MFQLSKIARCSVHMSADSYCGPKSSVALCTCLRTAIVSAVRNQALLCADVCGLLLFQRSDIERCSVRMPADCYCFSCPTSSVALCRYADCYCFSGLKSSVALCSYLRTAIVSAVRNRALLCADVCGLLLFQRSEIERCFVSAVRSRQLLCAHVCGLLLFQRSEIERCALLMSADCYCFSGPKSSVTLCRCLRTDCYCFSGPRWSVALCRYLRTALVSAV